MNIVLTILFLYIVIGIVIALELKVKTYDIKYPINNKVKIVQISDAHIRKLNEKTLLRTIRKVNNLNPDIVIFSGDLYDKYVNKSLIENTIKNLKLIKCEYKIAGFGNHDVQKTAKEAYEYTMNKAGFKLLNNDCIKIYNIDFYVLDTIYKKPKYKDCFKDLNNVILFSHEPDTFLESSNMSKIHCQISGHSHGGQIRFMPFKPYNLPHGCRTFYKRFYRNNNKELYICYGIGNSRKNIRFFVPKEINVYIVGDN